jgi:superfamily II DNA or RNA helicase
MEEFFLHATSSVETDSAAGPWEAGDRFEVLPFIRGPAYAGLTLPVEFNDAGLAPRFIDDEAGRPVTFEHMPAADLIELSGSAAQALRAGDIEAVWLEYLSPHRYRLLIERSSPRAEEREARAAGGDIEFDTADLELLHRRGSGASPHQFELGLRAARLATHPGFDRLISLPMVREMELLEHQTRTAVTVLRRLRGRALLCDEVGLGKTVEAGLILSELLMRGLVRSVLVLTPPSLITQWQGEMRRKFAVELTSHDDPAFRDAGPAAWAGHDRMIVSVHTAKREPHRSAILARKWDMVIVDEAHHLRNRTTAAWKFASELRKQFILLLTATPVQNNLEELFNLVTLLEPGLLSTQKDFSRRFVSRGDKLTPTNVDELHGLLAEVMVRNRRSTVGLQFTRRFARTEAVALTAGERAVYDGTAALVREGLRAEKKASAMNRMTLIMLQMALGSSTAAAGKMLENLLDRPIMPADQRQLLQELAAQASAQTGSAKADRLLQLLDEFPDKLVVFTQFRATQEMLRRRLDQAGHEAAVFHGGLSRLEKEAAIEQFRGTARLLICTESGSEGRNLQFAHGLCNFDLPWNPMKIEQRIGRLSRIGQKSDVHVFNLVAAQTVEAAVLHLLEAKLNMFELVIGEVDMILGNLDDEKEFEDVIADEWAASAGADEFAARMEVLGTRLLAAKAAYFRQRTQDEKLFGNRFAPEG